MVSFSMQIIRRNIYINTEYNKYEENYTKALSYSLNLILRGI